MDYKEIEKYGTTYWYVVDNHRFNLHGVLEYLKNIGFTTKEIIQFLDSLPTRIKE